MDIVNENVIEFLRNQERATITLCQPRFITRIRKLAQEYPEECKIVVENQDGSIMAHIPTKWIKFNPSLQLTEERRKEMAERMRSVRSAYIEQG